MDPYTYGAQACGAHMLVGPPGKCPLGPCVKTALLYNILSTAEKKAPVRFETGLGFVVDKVCLFVY